MSQWLTDTLTGVRASYTRELRAYFATPLAYVFIAIFLMMLGFLLGTQRLEEPVS